MYLLFYIIPMVVFVPVLLYLYIWCNRFFTLFPKLRDKIRHLLAAVCSLFLAYLSWPIYGTGGVVIIHFLVVCLLLEVINLIIKKRKKEAVPKAWSILYRSGVISVAVVVVILAYGYVNMHVIHEKTYQLSSDKVERDMRLAAISDLHLGTNMNADKLADYLGQIEAKKPDAFLLVGDIFDENTAKEEMEKASQLFGQMETTYGTYYVLGNHDPNSYVETPEYTMEEMCETLTAAGVHVLRDEAAVLDGLNIIGREDASMVGRKETADLAKQVDHSQFTLLIDHQPLGLQESADAGIDLRISGHTHAGQIWPTGILMELVGFSEMNYGYKRMDGMDMIVTSGIGGWGYAIRTGGNCEYLMIDIEKDSQ